MKAGPRIAMLDSEFQNDVKNKYTYTSFHYNQITEVNQLQAEHRTKTHAHTHTDAPKDFSVI